MYVLHVLPLAEQCKKRYPFITWKVALSQLVSALLIFLISENLIKSENCGETDNLLSGQQTLGHSWPG